MTDILSKEELTDAAKCNYRTECLDCGVATVCWQGRICTELCAETALHYMQRTEELEKQLKRANDRADYWEEDARSYAEYGTPSNHGHGPG